MKTKLTLLASGLILGLIFSYFIKDFYNKKDTTIEHLGILVESIKVIKKDVPYILELPGIAEPFETVNLQSLVTGHLVKVYVDDGEHVKTNDLLFEIDPRPFENQLNQAQATLEKDIAQLANAEKEVVRYNKLFKQKAISEEQTLETITNRDVLKATVESDQAAIESAKLQIEYSKIVAPMNGKISEVSLDIGNLVQENSSSLTIINQISPIYISFSVPEQYLSSIMKSQKEDLLLATIKTSSGEKVEGGKITFINNTIDTNSGTIKLKATLSNENEMIWPGQFVKVYLTIYNKKDAIVIPAKSVQFNQEGKYVFVINSDNKAQIRQIETDFIDNEIAVVNKGLSPDEIIVTNGQVRLVNGSPVTTSKP